MNNSKSFYAIAIALTLASSSVFAQGATSSSDTEKVILYNSQPVKVQLEGTGIKSFIGEAPANFMAGYDLSEKSKVNNISATPIQKVIKPEATVNAGYAIVSSDKILLNYKANFATLDKEMINKLDEIAAFLKTEPATRVLLTSHLSDDSTKASKLSDNRLGASTAYLKIKGVSLDRIQTQTQYDNNLLDVIVVNYMR